MHHRVAFLGFSDFERGALASYFRLAHNRTPCYQLVATLTDADFLVADADHGPSVQLVLATERSAETVFIGAQAPPGSTAWMMRPIDALHVMRELDAMVALGGAVPHADAAPGTSATPPATSPATSSATSSATPPAAASPPPRYPRAAAAPLPAAPAVSAAPASSPVAAAAPPVSLLERAHAPQPPRAERTPPKKPAARPAGWVPAQPAPLQPQVQPPAPPVTPRALLVDDSELALRFLASRLGRWQLDIDSATDSTQALDLLARHSYDVVFLDVQLGDDSELDGLALCQHIKQSPTLMNAAVVLVSAHHSELDRVRGALVGCDAYLAKPLDDVELQRLLLRHGLKAPKSESTAKS